MKSTCFVLVIGILLVSFVSASAQSEVWINPAGTDNTGSGTAASPYVRSSQSSFDTLMDGSAIPANSIIHLMPGTFLTAGDIPLQPGWKFRGAGIDVTTIRIVPFTSYTSSYGSLSNYEVRVIGIPPLTYCNNGVEVSDMTVDCNLQNQTLAVAIGAIVLQGGDTKISRVKAINWGSKSSGNECFIMTIGSGGPFYPAVTNCLIEDCIIEQPAQVTQAQGADGIIIGGGPSDAGQSVPGTNGWVSGAEIRNCRVFNVNAGSGVGEPEYFTALGIGNGVNGAKIDNNLVTDLGGNNSAIYNSCGSLVNCSIYNNMFLNVNNGISFVSDDYCPGNTNSLKKNLQIDNNFITVQTGGNGVTISGFSPYSVTNLNIANNIIQATTGAGAINVLSVQETSGLTAQNNIFDANGGSALSIYTNVVISQINNNQSLNGTSVTTSLWPVTNTAAYFIGNGGGLTSLNAENLVGTIPNASLTGATITNLTVVTNLLMRPLAPYGTPSTINFGTGYGGTLGSLVLYDDGLAGDRIGMGIEPGEFQFYSQNYYLNENFSWNAGGQLQTEGVNELMRLDLDTGGLWIGITNGSAKLDVNGSALIRSNLTLLNVLPAPRVTSGGTFWSSNSALYWVTPLHTNLISAP